MSFNFIFFNMFSLVCGVDVLLLLLRHIGSHTPSSKEYDTVNLTFLLLSSASSRFLTTKTTQILLGRVTFIIADYAHGNTNKAKIIRI